MKYYPISSKRSLPSLSFFPPPQGPRRSRSRLSKIGNGAQESFYVGRHKGAAAELSEE